jgi:Domain of unknown function (DUF4157)
MNHRTSGRTTAKQTERASCRDSSSGENAAALAPPAYGIDFVDGGLPRAASLPGPLQCWVSSSMQASRQQPADGAQNSAAALYGIAAAGVEGASQPLPHLSAIQESFGRHHIGDVQAYMGASAVHAAGSVGASAYAIGGGKVAFAARPSLHTAAHEAAHVVQQRGGIRLKDNIGRKGDQYERHADKVADAVVRAESAEALLDQVAGGRNIGTNALQGDLGFEIELPLPVVDVNRDHVEAGTKIADLSNGVTVETDHNSNLTGARHGYDVGCVEVVARHFSEYDPKAEEVLKKKLNTIRVLIATLNSRLANGPVDIPLSEEVVGASQDLLLTNKTNNGRIGQDAGYVQMTVGIAPSAVLPYLEAMESLGAPTEKGASAYVNGLTGNAISFAKAISPWAVEDGRKPYVVREVEGYLTLCYMQIAAMLNGNRDLTLREAQIDIGTDTILKNYARMLPRMSPPQMFGTMSRESQEWFMQYAQAIVEYMHDDIIGKRREYEQTKQVAIVQAVKQGNLKPKFAKTDGAISDNKKLNQLMLSVGDPTIGVDISSPYLFGKMAVAQTPDKIPGGMLGVPVEIRHHTGKYSLNRKNWMTRSEWEDSLRIWYLSTSRSLHGSEFEKRSREQ